MTSLDLQRQNGASKPSKSWEQSLEGTGLSVECDNPL